MITVRKIDLALQGFILVCALFSLLLNPVYLFLIEAALGIWQLISALLNTYSMKHQGNGYRKRIIIYWIISIAALLGLWIFSTGDVVFFILTHLCWGIALYYWILYLLFIQNLQFRRELSTVIRK